MKRINDLANYLAYFQATRSDELTIAVGDRIEVVEDGDLDQWVKARDATGQLGYVPENYLEFPPVLSQSHQYAFPPGDEPLNVSDTASISTSGTSSLTTTSSHSGYDKEVSKINTKASSLPKCGSE